jgi:hypothetical protein
VRITAISPDGSSSQKVVWVDPCGTEAGPTTT